MNTDTQEAVRLRFGTDAEPMPPRANNMEIRQGHNFTGQGSENAEVKKNDTAIIKVLGAIITVALVAIALGAPLFFTGLTFQGIAFEKQMYFYFWLLLALVAWASKGIASGELKFRRTPLDIPIAIFLVVMCISTAFSIDKWHSLWGFFGDPSRGLLSMFAFALFYYLVMNHFTTRRMNLVMGAIIFSDALLLVWLGIVFWGSNIVPKSIAPYLPVAPVGSVSNLSLFLAIAVLVCIAAIAHISEAPAMAKPWKYTLLSLLGIVFAANIFFIWPLFDFVPRLAVLVGASFFLIFVLARLVRLKAFPQILPFVFFAAILFIMVVGASPYRPSQALPIEASPNPSLSWRVATASLSQHPLWGSGPATYGYAFSLDHPQEFNANPFYYARFYQGSGLFYESLSTVGGLGSAAFFLLAVSFLSVVLYLLAIRSRTAVGASTLALVSATVMLLIAAMSVNLQGALAIAGVLIGSFALAALLAQRSNENRFATLTLKTSPKYALALAFVFMLVSAGVVYMFAFVARAYMADLYAGKAVRQTQVTEQGSIALLSRAIGFFPYEGRYYTREGQEYMVLANAEFLKAPADRDANKLSNDIVQAVAYARQGQQQMPQDVQANEVLAQVYENSLFYDQEFLSLAQDAYQKSLNLEPHNPLYLVKLGQIKATDAAAKTGDEKTQLTQQSQQYFRDAITQKSDYAPAHYQLGLALEADGNTGDAIIEVSRALQADQTNETYMAAFARLAMNRNDQDQMKTAAAILQQDLTTNVRSDALRLQYALILEKLKRTDDAIAQYKQLLSYVADSDTQTKTQLQTMISNAQSGIDNVDYLKKQQQASAAAQQGAAGNASTQPAAPGQPQQ